jgi:hypothetical protein
VEPPAVTGEAATVYLVDFGHHSGLVVPDAEGGLTMYSYGERDWFALNRDGPLDVFRVFMLGRPGSFARMKVPGASGANGGNSLSGINAEAVYPIRVAKSDAAAVAGELARRYDAKASTALYNPSTGLVHVDDDHGYNLIFHNCNHELADWLRKLGCRIRSFSITSDFAVEPSPSAAPATARRG